MRREIGEKTESPEVDTEQGDVTRIDQPGTLQQGAVAPDGNDEVTTFGQRLARGGLERAADMAEFRLVVDQDFTPASIERGQDLSECVRYRRFVPLGDDTDAFEHGVDGFLRRGQAEKLASR